MFRHITSPFVKAKSGLLYPYRTPTVRLQPIRYKEGIVFRDVGTSFDEIGNVRLAVSNYDKELYINYFEVDEPYWGRGYGREMYQWVEKYARRRGMERIILTPYDSAEGFWRKMGFKWSSTLKLDMVKALRARNVQG